MAGRYSLIIFDCDGVLVDSVSLGIKALVGAVRELGLAFSEEEAMTLFKGSSKMADCLAVIAGRLGRPLPEDFVVSLRARTAEVFRHQLQPVAGVRAMLDRLTSPICVASSGPREKIIPALSVTGLLPYFEGRIFSSYDIDSWKPSPDLFLHAAASLGFEPRACAVVEDSALGVQAGIAAGMRVFAYVSSSEFAEMKALGATPFNHMGELPLLLT